MIDYDFEDRKKKLVSLPDNEAKKLIWVWIKQKIINLKQFSELVSLNKQ